VSRVADRVESLEIAALFKVGTRAEWCKIMEGGDICLAPVLNMAVH
jgi:crotonobetainyl-CoA:carnitine CoA-transferase CaiB-like acyl-CoA transferase